MFFKKKTEEEALYRRQVLEQIHVLAEEVRDGKEVLASLCSDVKQNGKDISRHDMALEDCLDMLEECKEDRERAQRQEQAMVQEQNKLLDLLFAYQEHLWNMKAYAKKNDPRWHQQLLLVERGVQEQMHACEFAVVADTGCAVNYELHEVIEVLDTEDVQRDRTVAVVYNPGYLYQGKVRKKAKVAAYRLCMPERAGS